MPRGSSSDTGSGGGPAIEAGPTAEARPGREVEAGIGFGAGSDVDPGGGAMEPGMPGGEAPGSGGDPTTEKNSFAQRAIVAASGKPDGTSGATAATPSLVGVGIVVELPDLYVVEQSHGVVGQQCEGAIEGYEIRSDGTAIDPHEAHRQARALFTG